MLSSFKDFHLYITYNIMWYPDNQVRKNTQFVHTTTSKQKHPLQESDKNTKICISNLSMTNYIYLLRQQR